MSANGATHYAKVHFWRFFCVKKDKDRNSFIFEVFGKNNWICMPHQKCMRLLKKSLKKLMMMAMTTLLQIMLRNVSHFKTLLGFIFWNAKNIYEVTRNNRVGITKASLLFVVARVGPRLRESRTASLKENKSKQNRELENFASLELRVCEVLCITIKHSLISVWEKEQF